jgi:hypothetical protein
MTHSVGDGIIVAALAAVFIAYFYFKHKTRLRRLELIHQERLAAMDKGIPLPELPDRPTGRRIGPARSANPCHCVVGFQYRRDDRAVFGSAPTNSQYLGCSPAPDFSGNRIGALLLSDPRARALTSVETDFALIDAFCKRD